jgi:hypothetical protein
MAYRSALKLAKEYHQDSISVVYEQVEAVEEIIMEKTT